MVGESSIPNASGELHSIAWGVPPKALILGSIAIVHRSSFIVIVVDEVHERDAARLWTCSLPVGPSSRSSRSRSWLEMVDALDSSCTFGRGDRLGLGLGHLVVRA